MSLRFLPLLALVTTLTACGAAVDPAASTATPVDAAPTVSASVDQAPDAPAAAAAEAPAAAGNSTPIEVKNPVGSVLKGSKFMDPADGTVEGTVFHAIKHQAASGNFDGFLEYMHPSSRSEDLQVDQLRAYQYKSSQGKVAAACLHDDGHSLVTVSKKPVNATVAGGGSEGTKIMVWCGEGRMPVPFTVYPDGDKQKITIFGLN